MNLFSAVLRPGKVREVVDNIGTIKVYAPGLFYEQEELDKLPPVYPLLQFHSNQFSSPNVGDEIWVLNTNNTQQLYWFRKDNFENNDEVFNGEKNLEVLCSRPKGSSWATIYFSDNSGWIIKNDQSLIQLDKDGNILLETPFLHRCIDINSNNISIGSKGKSEHPAAYADKIEELLQKIYNTFNLLSTTAASSPYTIHLKSAIDSIGDWSKDISEIKSDNVTID